MESIKKDRLAILIGGVRCLADGTADEADIYYILCSQVPELFSNAASEVMGMRIMEEAKEGNPGFEALKKMNITPKQFANDFVTNARIMQIGAVLNDIKEKKIEPEMIIIHLRRHGIMEDEIDRFLHKLKKK